MVQAFTAANQNVLKAEIISVFVAGPLLSISNDQLKLTCAAILLYFWTSDSETERCSHQTK